MEWIIEIFPARHSNGTTLVDYMFNFLVDNYWPLIEGHLYNSFWIWAKDMVLNLGVFVYNYNTGKIDVTEEQYRELRLSLYSPI
jgi:hypothetical protein